MAGVQIKYLVNLRALATILVIMLHICADYMLDYKKNDWQWESVNAISSITRMCIGLFLMITGALLVAKTTNLKTFLKRRFSRLLLPFLFWSIVYIILDYYTDGKPLDLIIQQSIYFGAYYHFWYIYILIGIYLLIPVLSIFLIHANKNNIQYFLVIWTIWLVANMQLFQDIIPNINLTYFSGYVGYVVLGYYYHYIYKKTKAYKMIIVLVLGYLVTFIGTSISSSQHDDLETIFYQYLDINVALMAAGTFLLFKYYVTKTNQFLILISKYSFGIYFIHPLFIFVLKRFDIFFSSIWLVDIFIKTTFVLLISLGSIYILNKLPKGKFYIG